VAVIEWLIVWEWQTLNASDGTGWIALSPNDKVIADGDVSPNAG